MPESSVMKVGHPVMIDSHEGFGGPSHIIGTRDVNGSRYRVAMVDGNPPPFWAHDFEIRLNADHRPLTESETATHEHIKLVQSILERAISDLMNRKLVHDASKLQSPEKEGFEEFTAKLKTSTYGSDEYKGFLAAMKPFLDHHYRENSHHPEFFAFEFGELNPELVRNGEAIRDMSLLDLLEMLCDWLAASKRHDDGDVRKSIEINQKRFGYSDELKRIFLNTLPVIDGGK